MLREEDGGGVVFRGEGDEAVLRRAEVVVFKLMLRRLGVVGNALFDALLVL